MNVMLIGITCTHKKGQPWINAHYVQALEKAGAQVRILHPAMSVHQSLTGLHGLVLSGGGDMLPAVYGQKPTNVRYSDPLRDRYEQELLAAWPAQKPMLGICRGIQVMNAALGGTLLQHIPGHGPQCRHAVHVEPGLLASLMGGPGMHWVNSRHHQAVGTPAPGCHVTAIDPVGIIEGIEKEAWIGVQWHPETLCAENSLTAQMFFNRFMAFVRTRIISDWYLSV